MSRNVLVIVHNEEKKQGQAQRKWSALTLAAFPRRESYKRPELHVDWGTLGAKGAEPSARGHPCGGLRPVAGAERGPGQKEAGNGAAEVAGDQTGP